MRSIGTDLVVVGACQWSELAARRLRQDWLGRVWHSRESAVALLAEDGSTVVRIVAPAANTLPFDVVLDCEAVERLASLPEGTFLWRVRQELWVGDSLTIRLPEAQPWRTTLNWSELALDEIALHRRLAWLADFVLARARDIEMAGLLPELLAGRPIADRPDLAPRARLLHWRLGRALSALMPALAAGNVAVAAEATNRLAGFGPGTPTAGDHFLAGLLAGLRLWPQFLEATGLNQETIVLRLARTAAERTGMVGAALLQSAAAQEYGLPWHDLARALQKESACSEDRKQALEEVAQQWLVAPEGRGSSALAGLLLPFLWHQRRASGEG